MSPADDKVAHKEDALAVDDLVVVREVSQVDEPVVDVLAVELVDVPVCQVASPRAVSPGDLVVARDRVSQADSDLVPVVQVAVHSVVVEPEPSQTMTQDKLTPQKEI